MLEWLLLLGLSSGSAFPPDDCILLQQAPTQVTTEELHCPVTVKPGGDYHWSVTVDGHPPRMEKHAFQVADRLEYNADGRKGSDAEPGRDGGAGGNGRDFTVELRRGPHSSSPNILVVGTGALRGLAAISW